MTDSLKKLKNKDLENQLTKNEYNNDLIYDKLRWNIPYFIHLNYQNIHF